MAVALSLLGGRQGIGLLRSPPTCMPLQTQQYKFDIAAMYKTKSYRSLTRAWLAHRNPGLIKPPQPDLPRSAE
jgi:hypothetical protein